MGSSTGIQTKVFVWIRIFQLFFAWGNFVVSCVEKTRWVLVYGLFLPNFILMLLVAVDTFGYYKRRYALGAGRLSALRWITDLLMLSLSAAEIPVIVMTQLVGTEELAARWGPYNFEDVFTIIYLVFTGINLALLLSTFVMLCIEDARMRRRSRTLPPSATEPMPSSCDQPDQNPSLEPPKSLFTDVEQKGFYSSEDTKYRTTQLQQNKKDSPQKRVFNNEKPKQEEFLPKYEP